MEGLLHGVVEGLVVGAEDEELSFGDEAIGSGVEVDGEDAGGFAGSVEEVGLGETVEDSAGFEGFGEEEVAHEPGAFRLEVPGEEGGIGGSGDAGVDFADADLDPAILEEGEVEIGAAGAAIALGVKPGGGDAGLAEDFLVHAGGEGRFGGSDVALVDAVDTEDLVGEVVEVDGVLVEHHLDAGRGDAKDAREGVIDPALDHAGAVGEVVAGDVGWGGGRAAEDADAGGSDGGLDGDLLEAASGEGGGGGGDGGGIGGIDGVEDRFAADLEVVVEQIFVIAAAAATDGAGEGGVGGAGEEGQSFVGDEAVDGAMGSVADGVLDFRGEGVADAAGEEAGEGEAEGVAEILVEAGEGRAFEDKDVVGTVPEEAEDGEEASAVGIEGVDGGPQFVGEGLVVEEDVLEVGEEGDVALPGGGEGAEVGLDGGWLWGGVQGEGGLRKTAMWRSTDFLCLAEMRRESGLR